MNPFATFEMTPAFSIDIGDLDKRYRSLQQALHPDRFAQAPAHERQASLSKAVTVNQDYKTLKHALSRAEVLFTLHCGDTSAAACGETGADNAPSPSSAEAPPADPEFLMQVLEWREALSDAKADKNLSGIDALRKSVQAERETLYEALAQAFDNPARTRPAEDLDANARSSAADTTTGLHTDKAASLRDCIHRLRYIERFLSQAQALRADIEDAIAA